MDLLQFDPFVVLWKSMGFLSSQNQIFPVFKLKVYFVPCEKRKRCVQYYELFLAVILLLMLKTTSLWQACYKHYLATLLPERY